MIFPEAWLDILEGREELTTLADQIYLLRHTKMKSRL
jgi:hypothetical protein